MLNDPVIALPRHCGYCGIIHGPRCPSVQAIEYYQDGTVKRVEFVKLEQVKVDYAHVKIGSADAG